MTQLKDQWNTRACNSVAPMEYPCMQQCRPYGIPVHATVSPLWNTRACNSVAPSGHFTLRFIEEFCQLSRQHAEIEII